MDNLGSLNGGPNAALLVLTFLQADCRNSEYLKELHSLGQEFHLRLEEGELETDGHLPVFIRASLDDIQPSVELQYRPRNGDDAGYVRFAQELRVIAAQLEHNIVAQATQNLNGKISNSPFNQWKDHLSREVERVMRQGVGLEHLARERVIMALTLTLVKGVCEQAPRLLRNLFNIALQYVSGGGNR
ncbi:BH3 interacting domain death agonist [Labrus mixtus]|uniref:BH3 interacting domain death agonist n=1 Tax=Labrus mixtus TaxID=508554 RepID=UPI0029C045FF|nr:BH3 interacting domain death agonist [Labrus mixtus]XP_060892655.1 BH3 interacting domain death agonist [Labrus mixtus]